MVDHDAAILDHFDARRAQPLRGLAMMDSELHPDRPGQRCEGEDLLDVSRYMFRGAKEVDDVDVDRGVDLRQV